MKVGELIEKLEGHDKKAELEMDTLNVAIMGEEQFGHRVPGWLLVRDKIIYQYEPPVNRNGIWQRVVNFLLQQ